MTHPNNPLKWEIRQGDCIERMAEMDEASVDAIVTDPPYSLGFMGREWDTHGVSEDAAFGYYAAGFVDGEGHFRVSAGDRRCEFAVKLRADDRAILERLRRFLGHGRITDEKARNGSKPQARLIVDTKDGCAQVARTFTKYPLRARKARDFTVWAEAVREWCDMPRGNRWHGAADRSKLAAAGERLRAGREYVEPPWSGNAFQDWSREWATEALRVLKPGGHLLAFGGTRTYHRLACAIEDAGFEIRDCIAWVYGSGFPKSLDVSKAIDKAARGVPQGGADPTSPNHGNYRTTRTEGKRWDGDSGQSYGAGGSRFLADGTASGSDSEPAASGVVAAASEWQGWGTALKPAHEPIVVARKPLIGTVAANVLEHGTGALNVDACRIDGPKGAPASPSERRGVYGKFNGRDGEDSAERRYAENGSTTFAATPGPRGGDAAGRWPANVVLDPEAARLLDEQSGERKAGSNLSGSEPSRTGGEGTVAYGEFKDRQEWESYGDSGGASRFFYTAKSSRSERNAGLEGFASKPLNWSSGKESPGTFQGEGTEREARNHHPTVKPIALMRWLVRLVTPPGGVILDPFLGSGSTGCAAVLDGFDFIGIEREPEYVAIAEARISFWAQHVGREVDDVLGLHAASTKAEAAHSEAGQVTFDDLLEGPA